MRLAAAATVFHSASPPFSLSRLFVGYPLLHCVMSFSIAFEASALYYYDCLLLHVGWCIIAVYWLAPFGLLKGLLPTSNV